MVSIEENFRTSVESFLREAEMTPTRFGIDAAGDPRFVFDLREGRSCGARIMDRVMRFMEQKKAAA